MKFLMILSNLKTRHRIISKEKVKNIFMRLQEKSQAKRLKQIEKKKKVL